MVFGRVTTKREIGREGDNESLQKNWKAASKIYPNITKMCKRGGKEKTWVCISSLSPYIYTYIAYPPLWGVIPVISCIFAEAPSNLVKSYQKLLNLSNMLQICWEWCLQGPKTTPRLILGTPGGPKVHSSGHKGHPMRFKCRTRVPQGNPRAPKSVPRRPTRQPKWSETTPGYQKGTLQKSKSEVEILPNK